MRNPQSFITSLLAEGDVNGFIKCAAAEIFGSDDERFDREAKAITILVTAAVADLEQAVFLVAGRRQVAASRPILYDIATDRITSDERDLTARAFYTSYEASLAAQGLGLVQVRTVSIANLRDNSEVWTRLNDLVVQWARFCLEQVDARQ